MKIKIFLLFIFSSSFLKAQNEKFFESYLNYQNAISEGKYESALEQISLSIKELEKDGINDTTYSNILFEKGELLFSLNRYSEALEIAKIACPIEKRIVGEKHIYVANSYDVLARDYLSIDAQDSLGFYFTKKALELRKELLGVYHADVAMNLNNIAQLYSQIAQYNKALPFQEQAMVAYAKSLGVEHLDFAYCVNNLALIYFEIGQFEKALPLFEQALQIRKKALGEYHPDVAMSFNNLAELYSKMGQYDKSLLFQEQAYRIYKKSQGENHPNVAISLGNLAQLYTDLGQYERALPLNEQALKIRKVVLGDEHPDVAISLNNLAYLYSAMGQKAKALSMNEQALKIRRTVFGENNPNVAVSLNNLAQLYFELGQYEKALPYQEQALKILKNYQGEGHADVATSLNNLAQLYLELGQYEKALLINEQALEIRKKALGENHPDVAMSLNNISYLYIEMGQNDKALPFNEQALKIYKKTLGEDHPNVAKSLNNLANIYSQIGQYKKAFTLNEQALKIRKKALGKDHPEVASSLNNLALLYSEMGQHKKAFPLYEQSLAIENKQLTKILPSLTEEQKVNFLKLHASSYEIFDALVLDYPQNKYESKKFSLNNSLILGNVTMRSNELMRNGILNSNDSILIENFENWLGLKRQYANAQLLSLEEIKSKGIDIKVLEESIDFYEQSLSFRSQLFQTEQEKLQLDYETLKSRLSKDEAFLMFHSFNYFQGKSWTDSVLYAAYVVRPNQKEPEFVKLFEQGQLDSLMLAEDVSSMMSNLYKPSDSSLYNLLWKPIVGYLGDAKKVFIAPSGQLHKLAFAAIGDGKCRVLSDSYEIHQVLSAQDFVYPSSPVVFTNEDSGTTARIALFGGINYDSSKTVSTKQDSLNYSSLSIFSKDLNRVSSFRYLPATQKEIEGIQLQFKQNNKTALSYSGIEATEASFRTLDGDDAPKILHIATHGYFAPDPKEKLNKTQLSILGQKNRYTVSGNPLLRSGLMMAGCNASWKGTATLPGEEDGILTAQEVSNLNLLNTQLVVLSACETGLGDIQGREGVFGLQRAFRLAGAKYLLLSLWRIPDEETSEYMQLFYSELLKQNNITQAFKFTQRSMRQKYPNSPMKWAGMVLVE
jgi:tetratricopeptide (TPR) repeat protein/CHAT domain-containing protein